MKSKRGRMEIVGEILYTISKGETRKTRIMQSVFLGWRSFKEYMDFLLESGFIRENNTNGNSAETHYALTERGEKVLSKYLEIKQLLKFDYRLKIEQNV